MGIIEYQNWDGVTVGTIPSGWGVSIPGGGHNAITTEAAPLGCTPISSPNVLSMISSGSTPQTITRSTLDGNAGNVQIQADGFFYNNLATAAFSVLVRGSASTLLYASSSFYEFCLSGAAGSFTVNSIISGTSTNLFSVSTSALANGVWYSVQPVLVGSSITFAVVRLSDSMYLSMTTGTFGFTPTFGLINDSSISGQGYCGLGMLSTGLNQTLADDFTLSTAGVIVPSGPPAIARIATEQQQEPGRVVVGFSRVIPPTTQFARTFPCVARAEAPPQHDGCAYMAGAYSHVLADLWKPAATVLVQEAPRPNHGAAISHIGPSPQDAQFAPPKAQKLASTEAPPSPPGGALFGANRRVETPLARPSHPPIAVAEWPPPDPGSSTYHVNPHWDFPLRRTWIAQTEEIHQGPGSSFSATGGPPHVNPWKLPAIMAMAEAPPVAPGSAYSDFGQIAAATPFSGPPRSVLASVEPPPVYPGAVIFDSAPLSTIGFVASVPPAWGRSESPPSPPGQAIIPRPFVPTAFPTGHVVVVQAEPPRLDPGSASTSRPPAKPPRPGVTAIVASSQPPPPDPGSAIVHYGQPVATAPFHQPSHVCVAMAESPPAFPGCVQIGVLPQWMLPPFIIYADPRKGTSVPNDSDFTEVDPRKGQIGPEYPVS